MPRIYLLAFIVAMNWAKNAWRGSRFNESYAGAILVIARWGDRRQQGEYKIRPYGCMRTHPSENRCDSRAFDKREAIPG